MNRVRFHLFLLSIITLVACVGVGEAAAEAPAVSLKMAPGRLHIAVGLQPFATYVYQDEKIPRPYFCDVRAPCGTQVTRNHPPMEGKDLTDHPTYHPGMWLAFGDISGADFWRNRARVRHEEFVGQPTGQVGKGLFAVRNVYESNGKIICREVCRYTLLARPNGYLLLHDSEFSNDETDFVFGDQEEMGLGVRLATELSVKKGNGTIVNSNGQKNEKAAWGKKADWCHGSGTIGERRVGVTVMPHPKNFRTCWFHVRDYGFVIANPFGRNAYTKGEKSAVVVKKGETFRLRYGVFISSTNGGETIDPGPVYGEYLRLVGEGASGEK